MKRILCLVFLAWLLCGCSAMPGETTQPGIAAPELSVPTEPAGIYIPGSDLEFLTEGAVREYQPETDDVYAVAAMDNDLLVFSGTDSTTLTLLAGDNLFPVADAELGCLTYPENTTFQIGAYGITAYDCNSREIVFLDRNLHEVSRLPISSDLVGKPVLSSDRTRVFYCTDDAVRVYDLETGLDRLLRSISYPGQSVEASLADDTVIRCSLVDATYTEYAVFLSAEDGRLLAEAPCDIRLTTDGDRYYAQLWEDTLQVRLFGKNGEDPEMILPADPFSDAWFMAGTHQMVTCSAGQEETKLDLYDLESGTRAASVTLSRKIVPESLTQNEKTGWIYILGREEGAQTPVLLRWDPAMSRVEDSLAYVSRRYTREAPDVEGLEQCARMAAELGERYGLEILIGEAAAAAEPWDYTLESEYHVPVIRQQLESLAVCLDAFPEDFFSQISGTKRICLVRSITGKPESGSIAAASGLQFWAGDAACVALIPGQTMSYSFFHEMFHVIDGKILSDSRVYYYWHNLNPQGCQYFEDYSSYLTAEVEKYLNDSDRAFIDAYSMSFPKEDRARIMEYACNPGNAHYFQSETMQNKLKTLCQGIRQVFQLEKNQNEFLWEQYLREPLKTK